MEIIYICTIICLITIVILGSIITSHYYNQNKKYIGIVSSTKGKLSLTFEEINEIIIMQIDMYIRDFFITNVYPQCAHRSVQETVIDINVPKLIRTITSKVHFRLSKQLIENMLVYTKRIDVDDRFDELVVSHIALLVNIQITDNISVFQNDKAFKAKIKAEYTITEENKEKDE